jgi:cell wall-associated NlpC family hydrolase
MDKFISRAIGVPWVDKGRDFVGWDCWGLIVCFYRDIFKLDLNSYESVSCLAGRWQAVRAMKEEAKKWVDILLGEEKYGDVLIFRPLHSGVIVGNGKMLHCLPGSETCLERYNGVLWRSRLIGIYRNGFVK